MIKTLPQWPDALLKTEAVVLALGGQGGGGALAGHDPGVMGVLGE